MFLPESLRIENFLGKQDIDSITVCRTGSSHHGDDGVLLDVEWARVEVKLPAKNATLLVGKNIGQTDTESMHTC